MIMPSASLLKENPHPTGTEIREGLEGNLCRCTGYQNIVAAVKSVADGVQYDESGVSVAPSLAEDDSETAGVS